jgi:hypothetical protein
MLALKGQIPTINIANIPMPTPEERAEIGRAHRALDIIAAKLKAEAARERGDELMAQHYERQMRD